MILSFSIIVFFQAEDGIRDLVRSRGLGDVYKRQAPYTDNGAGFNGAWSVFPFFKSGIIIVNSIEQGLFLVRPTDRPVRR